MSVDLKEFLHRPLAVRCCNRLAPLIDGLGLPVAELSETSLVNEACRRTGLSDWGPDDSFRVPLRLLLDSYQKDSQLTLVGRYIVRQKLVKHLTNRLRIQEELKRQPAILQEEIRRPIFIVSLPRTGSTLLHRLLAQDPASRTLRLWESLSPAPATPPTAMASDPRIQATEAMLRMKQKLMPGFVRLHHFGAEEPEECFPLLENSLLCPSFYLLGHAPRYYAWLAEGEQDLVPTYRYYRQQLQIRQFGHPPRRWLLKAPLHMFGLKALLEVFPDACIIQTHRDLCQVIPSAASMVARFRGALSDRLDLAAIGQEVVRNTGVNLARALAAREGADPARFFDIGYRAMVSDHVAAIQALYRHFGLDFSPRFEEGIRDWLRQNPKNKRGVHRYDLAQFGLDPATIYRRFADYHQRFAIPPS